MNIFLLVLLLLLLPVVLYLLMIMPRMLGRPDFSAFKSWEYAHRGLYKNGTDLPENSLPAFQNAVDHNYGIELDVQLTRDNVPVVFHDNNLNRMCNVNKKVRDLSYTELQTYRLLDTDERIPTLQQVLHLVAGKTPLIIEYKMTGISTETCEIVDPLLQKYDGLYCIESFNPVAVLWYRTHRSHVVRGILSESFRKKGYKDYPDFAYEILHHMLLNFLIKPDFIAYNVKHSDDLSRTLCHDLYRAPAVAWTIKSQEQMDANRDNFDIFIFEGFIPDESTRIVSK